MKLPSFLCKKCLKTAKYRAYIKVAQPEGKKIVYYNENVKKI